MRFANVCSRGFFHVVPSACAALVLLFTFAMTGCGGAEETSSEPAEIVIPAELLAEPTPERIAELVEIGRAAFTAETCIACHAANGEALTGPALANIYQQEVKLADGRTVIRDMPYLYRSMVIPNEYKAQAGSLVMPPYARLDEETLVGLVYYVRSLSDVATETADAPDADASEEGSATDE